MSWEVEFTDEFEAWWETLSEEEQDAIDAAIELVEERGPALGRPLADTITQSRHANMKDVRDQGAFRLRPAPNGDLAHRRGQNRRQPLVRD